MVQLVKLAQNQADHQDSAESPQVLFPAQDDWQAVDVLPVAPDASAVGTNKIIAPLAQWLEVDDLSVWKPHTYGVALENTSEPDEHTALLQQAALITIPFPLFSDGRGYSLARVIREQLGYQGELRAVGDVLYDQLFYLYRCGFNAFELEKPLTETEVSSVLQTFTVKYQPALDQAKPLFPEASL